MKKYGKMIANIVFLVVLLALTMYFVLKDQELSGIMAAVHEAGKWWLLLSLLLVVIFVCSESVIIRYMMKKLGYRAPMNHCVKYSFIGFFYSCITPSASGGQPAQLYYMSRDGLDLSVSTLVLMIVTVAYKATLLVLSGLAVLTEHDFILSNIGSVKYILIYGIIANIAFIAFLLLLVFLPEIAKKIVRSCIHLLAKLHLIKREEERMAAVMESLDRYHEGAIYLKHHLSVLFNVLWISIFQRGCLFAVTWMVYKSFGLSGTSAWQIITLQAIIALAVDMLPLPGGVGASETSFLVIFDSIFGAFVVPGMLLSRGITYYILVVMSGAVSIYAHITSHGRKKIK